MKRTLSILLCVLIAVGVFAMIPANAADTSQSSLGVESNLIYFDANGWKNFTKVYCHIYEVGGDDFFGWQTGDEECKKVRGTIWSYDLSKLPNGGLKSGGKYCVIFSVSLSNNQSYDLTIGPECAGDTAVLTGDTIENPVDSNKRGSECVWSSNSDTYGPHLALTSIGNIVGSKLASGESKIQIIADWIPKYYLSTFCNPVDVLAKAYPKFDVKTYDDLTDVYYLVKAKVENGDYSAVETSDLDEIKQIMLEAFYKAYPFKKGGTIGYKTDISKWTVKGIKNKTYTGKALKQSITVVKNGVKATFKVSYSNNKNAGKATMTITGTGNYKGTIKKTFTIKKAANPVKVSTAIKTVKYNIIKYTSYSLSPVKAEKAKGKVTYKKISGSKALTVKSNGKVVVKKGTKKGLYKVSVNVKAKGDKNYSSKIKKVTAKIVVY